MALNSPPKRGQLGLINVATGRVNSRVMGLVHNRLIFLLTHRIELPHPVATNQNVTFSFNVTSPITSGLYNFQWRMVQEGVDWFGARTDNQPIAVGAQEMHIEAESFAATVGFQVETCSDIGGGQNVGYTDAGDTLTYNLNVAKAGEYHAFFRVASDSANIRLDLKNGSYRFMSFFGKKARGLMAAYFVQNRALSLASLKRFNWHGYRFSADESDVDTWKFLRDAPTDYRE